MPSIDNHFWMLLILCFIPIVIHFFRKPSLYNSSVSNGFILALIISLLKILKLDQSGTISTVLFVLFLIIPLFIQKKLSGHIINSEYDKAVKHLYLLKFFCPFFPINDCLGNIKKLASGVDLLSEEGVLDLSPKSIPSLISAIQIHFLRTEWQQSEKWLLTFKEKDIHSLPWLTLLNLRVLCETGQLVKAVSFTKNVQETQNQRSYFIYHLIYLCSFSGNTKLLKKIISLPIRDLKENNKNFWSAVCLYKNETSIEKGKAELLKLSTSEDNRIARSSKSILNKSQSAEPKIDKETLEPLAADLFENLEDFLGPAKKSYICTNIFLFLNITLYLITKPDLNPNFPYNNISEYLILFLPESIDNQQWWRLLTTTFLHGSLLHFLSNMFMLVIFGYIVEAYFKTAQMLFIYLGAGLVGMLIVTLNHSPGTLTITLGASGSTMALMGAYIAILLKQNKRSSVRLRKQQLIFLFILILVQSRIDLISPQISFTAHITGLVFGLLSAYLLYKPLYTDLENNSEPVSN